jgi:hypothetical protein
MSTKGKKKVSKKQSKTSKRSSAGTTPFNRGPQVRAHSAGSAANPLRAFADETFTVLRYAEQMTFNPGSATNSSNVFSANGCYDPNVTGTGHQPYGFDEYCAAGAAGPYNRYTVLRSRMKVVVFVPAVENATPGTAEARGGALVTINLRRENTTNFTNAYSNIEDPSNLGWKLVNQFQNTAVLTTRWADIGAYFGIAPKVYGSQVDFSGTGAANPSVQAYWIVSVSTPAQTVIDPIDVYAQVEIEYECRFWSQNASVVSVEQRLHDLEAALAKLGHKVGPVFVPKPLPPPPKGMITIPRKSGPWPPRASFAAADFKAMEEERRDDCAERCDSCDELLPSAF